MRCTTFMMLVLVLVGCGDTTPPPVAVKPVVEAPVPLPEQSEPVLEAMSDPVTDDSMPQEIVEPDLVLAAAEDATQAQATTGSTEIKLVVKDWDETLELVKSHTGKIVVMDLWSLACPPCLKEFPHLVELHKAHGDQIACISVALDYDGDPDAPLDSLKPAVLEQLKKFGATFDNVLMSVPSEKLFDEIIEPKSMPAVYVFDQSGKRVALFPNPENPDEFTYEQDILKVIRPLLAKPN